MNGEPEIAWNWVDLWKGRPRLDYKGTVHPVQWPSASHGLNTTESHTLPKTADPWPPEHTIFEKTIFFRSQQPLLPTYPLSKPTLKANSEILKNATETEGI